LKLRNVDPTLTESIYELVGGRIILLKFAANKLQSGVEYKTTRPQKVTKVI
jgi:hypothetical protein